MITGNSAAGFLDTYFLFFAMLLFSKKWNAHRLINKAHLAHNYPYLLLLHIVGIFLFGGVPLLTSPYSVPITASPISTIVGILILLLLSFSFVMAGKTFASVQAHRIQKLPAKSFLVMYFLLRVIFIIAYENWFRGYLLKDCIERTGIPTAIGINILLYALIHCVNGWREMAGCVPFGLLLCILCVKAGNTWPAVCLHLMLTLTYETVLIVKYSIHKKLQYESLGYRRFRLPGKRVGTPVS